METFENPEESENRKKSAAFTAVLTAILMFLLTLPIFSYEEPPEEPMGILLDLGEPMSDESSGPDTDIPSTDTEDTETETSNTSNDSSESSSNNEDNNDTEDASSKEVATSDEDDSINMKKKEEEERKKIAAAKKKAAEDAKKAKEEADRKAKEEADRIAKEKQDALDKKKKELSDLLGGGDGEDSNNNGDNEGESNLNNLDGITTGTGDVGEGFAGREVVFRPKITDNSQKTGIVVVKTCVGSDGKVISAKRTQGGSTTTDATLIKLAEDGVKKYRFSPGERDKQCGTITVKFSVK